MIATADTRAFIDNLARLPDADRKERLSTFFRDLSPEDPSHRTRIMQSLLEEVSRLPHEARRKYLQTRTEVLAELPMSTQMALMATYREILLSLPPDQVKVETEELRLLKSEIDPRYSMMVDRFLHFLPGEATPADAATEGPAHRSDKKRWWQFWMRE